MHQQRTGQCSHGGIYACRRLALLLAVSALLAACNAPIGPAPTHQGTYLGQAFVTNPNGGGPQIIMRGPPETSNSESR
jgi:hypothetical protein